MCAACGRVSLAWLISNQVTSTHTWALLVREEAAEAWLDRALLRALPVMLDVKVVVPTVVS